MIKKAGIVLVFLFSLILALNSAYAAIAGHVVISEIQTAGVTANDEFIELYNPTASLVNLSNWSIQIKSATGSTWGKKNFNNGDYVHSHGFFLITHNDYTGNISPDMSHSSFILSASGGNIFLVNNQTDLTSNSSASIIDKVAYGNGDSAENFATHNPDTNQSIERKSALTHNELEGNGWDTDNNSADFVNRTTPQPQNSNNATEWDATAPVFISWNNPSINNSNVSGALSINVSLNDSRSPINIVLVSFSSTNYTMANETKYEWNYTWNTALNSDGYYNITVYYNDTYNNKAASTLYNTLIDNTNPYLISWNGTVVNNAFFSTGIKTINITANDSLTGVKEVKFVINNASSIVENLTAVKNNYNWHNSSLNVSAYSEGSYNLTAYITDHAGSLNSSEYITITIDRTYPTYRNATLSLNQYNYTDANANISASINTTDTNLKNVTCMLNDSTTVAANLSSGNIYSCTGLQAPSEADYLLYFDVLDKAGNLNTTTSLLFTTRFTTHASITADSLAISDLNQSDKIVFVNATITNTGSSPLHAPRIIIDGFAQYHGSNFASAANSSLNCSEKILPGATCTTEFNLTITGGLEPGSYLIEWTGNWTNNNLTKMTTLTANDFVGWSFITISSTPQITTSINETKTISHSANSTFTIYINSTGNADLQNVAITYTANTLLSSWLNISNQSFSSIPKEANQTFNVAVSVPRAASPGNYTGNLTISASSASSKNILLRVEVPPDYSVNSYPNSTIKYVKSSSTGSAGTIYINNSGNLNQNFTLSYSGTFWTYVADRSLTPASAYVSSNSVGSFNIYYNRTGLKPGYLLTITITSPYSGVNHTYLNMTIDDNAPIVNITSPSPNAYIAGAANFNVSVTDANTSRIEYYISNSLLLNSTGINYTYSLNTSLYSDNIYALTAIAYDSAGNYNSSSINITINNTDSAPQLYNLIPAINWTEDTTATLNLSLYFRSIDGDSLNYSSTNPVNVTVAISGSIAAFNPDANFSGINYIVFYANDTSGNITASNNVTLNITNVNDIPTMPSLIYPSNNTEIYSAAGQLTLNWSAVDVDGDSINFYLYFSNSTNLALLASTTNSYYPLTSLNNNTKYYWRVNACDAVNCSGNSSIYSFNVTFDSAPIINSYIPASLTPSATENSSLFFSANATDPDNGPLNYTWKLDNIINKTNGNNFTYYPGFNDSGTHTVIVTITDNNSNIAANTWTVSVINTDRAPVLSAIANKTVNEDSTLLFNITATDPDLAYGDNLTYSSNLSAIIVTQTNNTLALVNWTPTNSYVGNNSVKFTVTDTALNDSKTIIITVINTNDAPVLAAIGAQTASQGSLFYYDVNATDVDTGDTLTFYDNTTLFDINSSTGIISFTPSQSDVGTHYINIIVNDSSGASDSEVFALAVSNTNDAPVLAAISSQTVNEDSALTFNITASDVDGDNLTYSCNLTDLTVAKQNNSLTTVSWTPTNSNVGNNSIKCNVTDGALADSSSFIITVINTNDAPTIASYYPPYTNPKIADSTGSQLFNITGSDIDIGDTLTTAWHINGIQNTTATSYTAASLSSGNYNITAVISDGTASVSRYWNLTVSAVPLSNIYTGTILSQANLTNATDVTINHTTHGSIDFGSQSLNLDDVVDIDRYVNLSKGIVGIDTSVYPSLNKSATITMKGLSYATTPIIYYNSGFSLLGTTECPSTICSNITYSSSTGVLIFNVAHFSLFWIAANASNQPPTITSTAKTTATQFREYSYDVDATDVDNDTITYMLSVYPLGMSISSSSGLISWTPNSTGTFNTTVIATDGNYNATQSFNIIVSEGSRLLISKVDVKVDSKSDKDLNDGNTISKEAEPESDIEFKIEVKNLYSDDDDIDIENIAVTVTIKDIDDGDDLEEESSEFDLRPEADKRVTINFKLPLEIDEDIYEVEIEAAGEDENNTDQEASFTLYLEVKKKSHEIRVRRAYLSPSEISCQRAVKLETTIINTGNNDEDDVSLRIESAPLGINQLTEDIELDEGTSDNTYESAYNFDISDDIKAGTYSISIKTYYDSKSSGYDTAELAVKDCVVEKEVKQEHIVTVKKADENITVAPAAKPVEKKPAEIIFRESASYVMLLVLLYILVISLGILMVVYLIKTKNR